MQHSLPHSGLHLACTRNTIPPQCAHLPTSAYVLCNNLLPKTGNTLEHVLEVFITSFHLYTDRRDCRLAQSAVLLPCTHTQRHHLSYPFLLGHEVICLQYTQQGTFLRRLCKLLHLSPRTLANAFHPCRNDQSCNPLDVCLFISSIVDSTIAPQVPPCHASTMLPRCNPQGRDLHIEISKRKCVWVLM
jgi:hypothetical protein